MPSPYLSQITTCDQSHREEDGELRTSLGYAVRGSVNVKNDEVTHPIIHMRRQEREGHFLKQAQRDMSICFTYSTNLELNRALPTVFLTWMRFSYVPRGRV